MDWTAMTNVADEVITAALAELPPDVRTRISSVAILLEDRPGTDDLASGIEEDTLGYFDEDDAGIVRIRLWLDNIHDYAESDPLTFRKEVRTTLLHEIGHVLGWDEQEVEERGLG